MVLPWQPWLGVCHRFLPRFPWEQLLALDGWFRCCVSSGRNRRALRTLPSSSGMVSNLSKITGSARNLSAEEPAPAEGKIDGAGPIPSRGSARCGRFLRGPRLGRDVEDGATALFLAVRGGHFDVVKMLSCASAQTRSSNKQQFVKY